MVQGALRPIFDGIGSLSSDVLAPTIYAANLRQYHAPPERKGYVSGEDHALIQPQRPAILLINRMKSNGTSAGEQIRPRTG